MTSQNIFSKADHSKTKNRNTFVQTIKCSRRLDFFYIDSILDLSLLKKSPQSFNFIIIIIILPV